MGFKPMYAMRTEVFGQFISCYTSAEASNFDSLCIRIDINDPLMSLFLTFTLLNFELLQYEIFPYLPRQPQQSLFFASLDVSHSFGIKQAT